MAKSDKRSSPKGDSTDPPESEGAAKDEGASEGEASALAGGAARAEAAFAGEVARVEGPKPPEGAAPKPRLRRDRVEPMVYEPPKASRIVVAPGCAFTSCRGILGPGAEVQPDDFVGKGSAGDLEARRAWSLERIAELLAKGRLVRS